MSNMTRGLRPIVRGRILSFKVKVVVDGVDAVHGHDYIVRAVGENNVSVDFDTAPGSGSEVVLSFIGDDGSGSVISKLLADGDMSKVMVSGIPIEYTEFIPNDKGGFDFEF
jgi:hypothetical protein